MALKHKGEYQVEHGFGLPKKTTEQRLAYIPPEEGYQVFDTDLGRVATWTIASDWLFLGLSGDVDDEKIDIVDGVGRNTISLKTQEDEAGLKFTAGTHQLTDFILEKPLIGSGAFNSGVGGGHSHFLRSYGGGRTSAALRADEAKSSGKWYWETIAGTEAVNGRSTFAGISVDISTLGGEVGLDANSWGIQYSTGQARHDSVATTLFTGSSSPQTKLSHKLDLDNGIYEISVNGGAYIVVDNNLPSGSYVPVLSVRSTGVTVIYPRAGDTLPGNTPETYGTTVYPLPEGFSHFMDEFIPSSGGVKIESEQDDGDLCIVNTDGNTEFALKNGEMTANAPILGVDGTDPASLITRSFAGRYLLDFITSNWVTNSGVSSLQLNHGLIFVSGETIFDIQVSELVNGSYKHATIEHITDETTGAVTLRTLGSPFNGRVRISK